MSATPPVPPAPPSAAAEGAPRAAPSRSIVRRLMLALTVSIALASVGAVLLLAAVDTRRRSQELERATDSAVRELARVIEPALWDLDMQHVAQIGAAFADDPRVVRLAIRDNTTGILRVVRSGAETDTVARSLPVTHEGREIGHVELALSRATLRHDVRDQVLGALRASLIALIAAFLVVRLLVRRLLDAPLDELAAEVAGYDDDRPAPATAAIHYEEFETLHEVLTAMRTRIARQLRELQATNLRLTHEVESHQRTEQALLRSRNLEIQVINSVPQAIFWKDLNGVLLGANAVFARAVGATSPEEVVGRTNLDLDIEPLVAGQLAALDREVVERKTAVRHVIEMTGREGRDSRWWDIARVPLADDADRIFGVLGVAEDITERNRADEALRRRNRELASLNRFLALAATDVPAPFLMSRACEEITTSLGLPYGVVGLFDEHAALLTLVDAANGPGPAAGHVVDLRELPVTREFVASRAPLVVPDVRADPRFAPALEALTHRGLLAIAGFPLVVEGEVIGVIVIGTHEPHDFTEAELALAAGITTQAATAIARYRATAAQRLLRAAIEQTPDCVLITDTTGRIVYANEAFTTLTQYERSDALGATPRLLRSATHPPSFFAGMWERLARGETWRGRITNRRRDGSDIVVDAIIAPVRDEQGTIANYIAVESDVTQELVREERFRHAQRMDAVGQLAGGIAHDFNNILGAITMELELLEVEHTLPEGVRQVTTDIRASAQRAANLTRQLLMFSRRQVMTMRPHDLNMVVSELLRMLGRLLGERVAIDFQPAPAAAVFEGDAGMIEQVIVNLCVNARDAMPAGGTLTVTNRLVQVAPHDVPDTSEAAPGRYVLLEIRDTGTGMGPETLARLFEPFFTTKDVGKGTGLGLATAHGLVAQHHGWIEVDSTLGAGSSFRVYLPAAESTPAGETAPVRIQPATAAATVLLVEDEAPVRRVVARGLRRLGYHVLEATDGVDAKRVWAEAHGAVDLLLTDMVMPERLSGLDLAVELTSQNPALKVVIMSGYDVRLVGDNAGLINDVDFLGKPFSMTELGELMTRLLGEAKG